MGTQRWPWRAAGTLLLVAAAATAASTYLHWLPCRGSMLNRSIFRGYAYGSGFSDACLRRMDAGLPFPYPPEPAEQAPWAAELGVAAVAAAALAWLVLLVGRRWSLRAVVVALPGLALAIVALLAGLAARDATRGPDAELSIWLWLILDVSGLIALVAVGDQHDVRRLALVLWGITAFGFVQFFGAYLVMGTISDADWDLPPGTGYPTAAVLLVSGVVTLALAGSAGQEPQHRNVPLRGVADQDPVRTVLEDDQH